MAEEYTCAMCGETYEKARPDSEALEELAEKFPGLSQEDCDIVCDDCFSQTPAADINFVADPDVRIMALLDERLREAEAKFLALPEVKAFRARQAHMFMEHGTIEECNCPEFRPAH